MACAYQNSMPVHSIDELGLSLSDRKELFDEYINEIERLDGQTL